MKKLFSVALSFMLILSISMVAFASEVTPKVIFSAKDELFSFENVIDNEYPDLFVGFKNVIPGDKITQNIDVEIKGLEQTDTVKIYLKSETTDKVYTELLKSIDVNVKKGDEDITQKLSEQVLLGTFKADDLVKLVVTLDIPITVGNEIQSLEAYTNWIFIAEILEDSNVPQTGDENNDFVSVILCLTSLSVIAIIFLKNHN